jgi:hypothetical protein
MVVTFHARTWQAAIRDDSRIGGACLKTMRITNLAGGRGAVRGLAAATVADERSSPCAFVRNLYERLRAYCRPIAGSRRCAATGRGINLESSSRRRLAMTGSRDASRPGTTKSVAVVSRDRHAEVLDTVLDAGDYDIVFVESIDRAYSCIKRVTPDLVIVCLEMGDAECFQLLSMLNLDRETAEIPVCTYVVPPDLVEPDERRIDVDRLPVPRAIAASMN